MIAVKVNKNNKVNNKTRYTEYAFGVALSFLFRRRKI